MASDFIKEKIKDRPVDKRKLAKRIGFTVLVAVIFGAVAAVTFSIVYSRMNPPRTEPLKTVEFSDAEEPDPENAVSEDEAVSDDEAAQENEVTLSENEAEESEPEKSPTIINNITNRVDLSPESYAKLRKALHEIAADAGKALVTVTATTTDTDWFENPYESGSSAIGLIVADNGKQLLILTDGSVTKGAEEISVKFADDMTAVAGIIKSDADTSLQIIGVELSDIGDETKDKIEYASLGSTTYASTVGTPVIAIGSPLGIIGSEAYGSITSMSQEEVMSDFNVHLLTTDIYGSENASGAIIDYNGRVLGVVTTSYETSSPKNMIAAYSISDIKDTIENLANGKDRTYLGIVGTSVTQEAVEAYDIPMGAYVINVDADSPAMEAGIQSGDVITRIGTQNIENYSDYTNALLELAPGVETVITVQRFSRGDYTELTFEAELSKK